MPTTRRVRAVSALLLLAGCAHTGAARVDPEVAPSLPSPRADVYTRAPGTPSDPLVAAAAAGLPWDEALSGVATAIAMAELGGDRVDGCRLRWMAAQAAYPYPVRGWLAATVGKGEIPATLLEHARAYAQKPVDIGLVRARIGEGDRWVLVVADRRGEVPAIAREAAVGETLTLGAGDWRVSDPLGEPREVADALVLDAPGEWLVQARAGGAALATFPVYVGETMPEVPPYACAAGDGAPDARAASAVAAVRDAYGYAPLARDPALDSVARARLRAWVGREPLPAARDQLRAAGFIGVPVAAGACRAATVEACLEGLWWSPDDRGALVGDLAEYGLAVDTREGDVRIVLVGAG